MSQKSIEYQIAKGCHAWQHSHEDAGAKVASKLLHQDYMHHWLANVCVMQGDHEYVLSAHRQIFL